MTYQIVTFKQLAWPRKPLHEQTPREEIETSEPYSLQPAQVVSPRCTISHISGGLWRLGFGSGWVLLSLGAAVDWRA